MSYGGINSGAVVYLPFDGQGDESAFHDHFSGAILVSDQSKLYFTARSTVNASLVVNVIFLTQAYLEIQNGSISEFLSWKN